MEQNQEQKKQSLISAYNTARLSVGFGKLALQLAAKTATTIATSPVAWIAIGIGIVVVGTFLIVFSAGAPSFPTEETTTPATIAEPVTEPTTSPTPTLNPEPTRTSP